MTTPFWCLIAVALLPYVLAGVGGYFRIQQLGSLDNNHPRTQAQQLEGIAARAYAAQQNAWEALPFFGTAVFLAHLAGADADASATAAIAVVAARVLHPILYMADQATARSVVHILGLIACIRLFWLAASA